MRRTHRCGDLGVGDVGESVRLQGWVWHRRDLGGLVFVDLRDHAGFVQCVFNPGEQPEAHGVAREWRSEFVVEVAGTVARRDEQNVNPEQATGEIEVVVEEARLLAASETPPFVIEEDPRTSEEMRLRHRYLDLRRGPLQRNLRLRHELALAVRNLLDEQGFLEVETPMLTRSTPEGARDYLVPSRIHPGHFYALPQSPQLFKQLLMISGYDRYFQIVKCFRDEALRADRQPEFTQIDLEMSFVEPGDVQAIAEALMRRILETSGADPDVEFEHLSFREAVDRYGSDRPDLRYGHELVDATREFRDSPFKAFAGVVEAGGAIKALAVPGGADWSRSRFDELTETARDHGAKGLVWMKLEGDAISSPVAKFVGEETLHGVARAAGAGPGDAVLLVGDEWETACTALGAVRVAVAATEGWAGEGLRFVWVTEFPLFERIPESGRLAARHHPFTSPVPDDVDLLESDPLAARARSYDLVLNGVELGGGSIRNHRVEMQERVFAAMGMDGQEARERFGFLVDALRYGAPPHGGIAFGFDRIVRMMAGAPSLREVIAFPKTTSASDLMTGAPGTADPQQLEELHIDVLGRDGQA